MALYSLLYALVNEFALRKIQYLLEYMWWAIYPEPRKLGQKVGKTLSNDHDLLGKTPW